MKVAVLSDIHGNMQALEAVLEDIKKESCDKIFCLGDIAMAGPEPVRVTELIKKMSEAENFTLIQGNTDEMIGNFNDELSIKVKSAFPIMGNALENDVQIMPQELKGFLNNLPKQAKIEIEGVKILLVHGSPRRNDENITPDLPIEAVEEMVSDTDADLIFCGHTHIPCGYQTKTKQTIVNVGSVGRPFTENPKSCYVVADFKDGEFEIMHKLVSYNNKLAAEILSKRDFEGSEKLAKILIKPEFRHI